MIHHHVNTSLEGQYILRTRKAATLQITKEVGPFCNTITNLGLDRVGTTALNLTSAYVGTGTNPAAVTDTTMGTYKATSSGALYRTRSYAVAPDWFAQEAITFTFPVGTATGNLTEVGVGWSNLPANALWSRELTVDSSGNPVTITVLSDEILEVVYSLRQYIDVTDHTGSFTLNDITYNYTARTFGVGTIEVNTLRGMQNPTMSSAYRNVTALSAFTAASPFVGGVDLAGTPTYTYPAYVPGSFTLGGVTSVGLTTWNHVDGINGLVVTTGGSPSLMSTRTQYLLSAPIPKTNLNTMTFTWSSSWGRHTP